jgi:hypothetical protein
VTARDDYPGVAWWADRNEMGLSEECASALSELDALRAVGDRLAALLRSGEREYASVALAEWDRLRGVER